MKNLGIIAGNGDFPILVAKGARKCGVEQIVVAAFIGETKSEIEMVADVVVWTEIGKLNSVIHCFKKNGSESVVMAGQITPTLLFTRLKLDLRMTDVMKRIQYRGAGPFFGSIAEELGKDGIRIIESTEFIGDQLADAGNMTKKHPDDKQSEDIQKGLMVARKIADMGIGETVVVKEGTVVSVEGVEGTNETIRRAGGLVGPGLIVVKACRGNPDHRFEIPVIGEETLRIMHRSGANVLILEAGNAIMINKERVIKLADELGISIIGMEMRA